MLSLNIGSLPLNWDILTQPDIDGRRGKYIAKILEFDLEIKPTKSVKG
jgi:hypothetical protein